MIAHNIKSRPESEDGVSVSRSLASQVSDVQVINDPKQVKSLDELKARRFYRIMRKKGEVEGILVEILSTEPDAKGYISVTENPHLRVTENPNKPSRKTGIISLRDVGILPYENGKWNAHNYLVPVD